MVKGKKDEFESVYKHENLISFRSLMRCQILVLSIVYFQTISVFAQDITVRLLERTNVSTVLFSPTDGKYVLINEKEDTIYVFKSDDAISVAIASERLLVKSAYGLNDIVSSVRMVGVGNSPNFHLRFNADKRDHSYFDRLTISVSDGALKLVNHVSIERYVARVVQSEVGYGADEEYYKIQSIICRTYATRNLVRHVVDGYDLCDHEHCQVYSGLKPATNEVMKATSATSGLVMVDQNNNLILSAFHANCGGQTANSEDVWREARSYLTSVEDTFCTGSRSAVWHKSMPVNEFVTQLGFSTNLAESADWSFKQPNRKKYFTLNADSVETAQMRRLLQLRSTYFDLQVRDGNVEFAGRGYGHGVGLCQQGAMKMAEIGYSYSQILGYYYKGVSLIPTTSLQPEK
ncbi:MAG: SpoIID/LytB domain-containing protein [Flavobacteriales bacterium]|nr:SpoIID/LytB domain-containing protein [Flavobacteriales bacterium]